jgi:hypothetical protein
VSKRDEQWAAQLLQRACATREPRPGDAARNLAGIEARLGLAGVHAPSGPHAIDALAGAARTAPAAPRSAPLGARTRGPSDARVPSSAGAEDARARWMTLGSPGHAGLVLTFGLVTGVIGYFIGRSEAEPQRAPMALDSPSIARPHVAPRASGPVESSRSASGEAPVGEGADPLTTDTTPPEPSPPSQQSVSETRTPDDDPRPPHRVRGVPPARVEPRATRSAASDATPPPAAALAPRAPTEPPSAPPAATRGRPLSVAADPTPDGFDLREALELLRRAENAVRRSEGLEARMWLTDLDRRAPPPLLREERLVTLTLAHCLLGNTGEARATLAELELANPESIYRARLEGSCVSARVRER